MGHKSQIPEGMLPANHYFILFYFLLIIVKTSRKTQGRRQGGGGGGGDGWVHTPSHATKVSLIWE